MIHEDRSDWWLEVAAHPQVQPHLGGDMAGLAELVRLARVTPLRSENGGFLFIALDAFSRLYELHTLYRPEGWGREVLAASKAAFATVFERGAQVIATYEQEDWWRSRPPLSFGFRPAGGFASSATGPLRTWILTRAAWDASPARRRME